MRFLVIMCVMFVALTSVSVEAKILNDTYKFGSKKGQIKTTPTQRLEASLNGLNMSLSSLNETAIKQNEATQKLLAASSKNTDRLAKALSTIAKLQNKNNKLQQKIIALLEAKK